MTHPLFSEFQRDLYKRLWYRDARLLNRALLALDAIAELDYDDAELEGFQVADDAIDIAKTTAENLRKDRSRV